jgi:HAMP domain-containing protein
MEGGIQWLLDIALIVLLGVTLFHALRLERALGVLRRDRSALEELVAGFNASTRQAEQGIERLRGAADGVGKQIARQIDAAEGLKDDLVFLSERGERLADKLDKLVRAARQLAPDARASAAAELAHGEMIPPARAPEPMPAAPPRAENPRRAAVRVEHARGDLTRLEAPPQRAARRSSEPAPAGAREDTTHEVMDDPIGGAATDAPRLRSQAERDLLRALRLPR